MKTLLKILMIIVILVIGAFAGAKFWIEGHFDEILNKAESRNFNVYYGDISLDYTLNGITLNKITIVPVDTISAGSTAVYGTVETAVLEGIDILPLIFSDKLAIDNLRFENPDFIIYLKSDTTDSQRSNVRRGMGQLFGEIIERASLRNFAISGGSVEAYNTRPDTLLFGAANNIRIDAYDIQTDKERLDFIIPFEAGGVHSHLENIEYVVDEHRHMQISSFDFNSKNQQLLLKQISMKLDTGWFALSYELPYHQDLIEFTLRSLLVDGIAMQNVYGDFFKLYAHKLVIDSLDLNDFRNKKRPEPPDIEKPMFKGMLDYVNVPIDVDSILVNNSSISYTEMPPSGEKAGTVSFHKIHGFIEDVTTDTLRQDTLKQFHAHLDALVNGQAPLSFDLVVPYSDEHFYIDARLEPFDLNVLNSTMEPLASMRIDSGRLKTFQLKMSANRISSDNELLLDYEDLKLSVLDKDSAGNEKKGLMTALANIFVKKDDNKNGRKSSVLTYNTNRDIYRGPWNYMWQSVKEGMMEVAPTTVGSLIIPKSDQKKAD